MKKLTTLFIFLCLCTISTNAAQDGSWALTTGGDYSNPGNWIDGNIADDATSIAHFTNGITATAVISFQNNRTNGTLNFSGEADQWWFDGAGNTLTLDNGGSTPVIDVEGNFWGASINANLSGSDGFTKTGSKLLNLYVSPVSGDIDIQEGALRLAWESPIPNINNITVGAAGTLIIGETNTLNCPLTLNHTDTWVNAYALDVEPGKVCNINSNVTMTADSGLVVTGNGSGENTVLNLNSPVSGAYSLRLMGRAVDADVGIFNINAVNTYSGNTTLCTWGSNPLFELNVNQGIPLTDQAGELRLEVYNSSANSSVTLDLNDKIQKVSTLFIALDGSQSGHSAVITGNDAGVLEITNVFTTWESAPGTVIKQTGGKIICNGPGCGLATKMIIANATFINNGAWWGGPLGEFELQAGGKIGGTGFLGWETSASNLVITSGATITPGNSIGQVGCWNLELEEGSMYDWEVDDGSFDAIDVRSNLFLPSVVNSVTVNVSHVGDVQPGQTNWLIYVTTDIIGSVDSIYMDYPISMTGPEHPEILYGHVMVTDLIPEPATLGLLALLGLAFLRRK